MPELQKPSQNNGGNRWVDGSGGPPVSINTVGYLKKEDEFISLTKTFLSEANALAYVRENDEKFIDEWEKVEVDISYRKGYRTWRVELIYRKRQTELDL